MSVDWGQTSVPRTAVKQDLLYSLGSALTICSITRNDGAWRLQQLLLQGHDPGARSHAEDSVDDGDDTVTESAESGFDLERIGRDQIQAFVAENFAGHQLSRLVAEVLKAEGFITQVAPPGPDGGIDVFAGRGPLGLDSPRLIVQVKSSPSPVDVKVVRELKWRAQRPDRRSRTPGRLGWSDQACPSRDAKPVLSASEFGTLTN